jgi:hypothetical protein
MGQKEQRVGPPTRCSLLYSSQPKAKLGDRARWVDFSVAAEAAKIAP